MTEYEKLSLVMLRNIQRLLGNVLVMAGIDDVKHRVEMLERLQPWLSTFPPISDAVDRAVAEGPDQSKPAKARKKKKK